MRDIIKIGVVISIIIKVIVMVISGTIPLPKFMSNALNLKKMTDGDTIQIQGMGHFNYSTLIKTKKIVEETYVLPTKIVQPIVITSESYVNGMVNVNKCFDDFDDNQNKIIITNEVCYSIENEQKIAGEGEKFGNILIIGKINHPSLLKSVLRHEIGHNEGLGHCDNPKCIMFESIKKGDDKYFCEKCRKK